MLSRHVVKKDMRRYRHVVKRYEKIYQKRYDKI